MTEVYDIAFVGGGIAALSAAYFLAGRRSAIILESEDALGYHATGRSAAEFAFRFHTPLAGRLAALSFPFLDQPPDGFCEGPLLTPRGILLVANDEKRAKLAEVHAREGGKLELLTADEALERAPVLNPAGLAGGLYDPECWDIDVEQLFQGYQRGVRTHGGVIRSRAALLSAKREVGIWHIETRTGPAKARMIVNAAGAWADDVAGLCRQAPLGLMPLRRTAITVSPPQGMDMAGLPEIEDVDEDWYMKPDAGKLLVSPADEHPSPPCDAQPEEIDIAWAMHHVHEATILRPDRPSHAWAGLRTFAPDRAPIVGQRQADDGFFWLAGQGGFGIQTSPALGLLAATILAGDPLSGNLAEFGGGAAMLSPNRFPLAPDDPG